MYGSNSLPTDFKYIHEDASSQLFVDINKSDGVSLVLSASGFTMCQRELHVPDYWDFNGEDLLRSSKTPEVWIRLDYYTVYQQAVPKRALTDAHGRVMIVP